MKVAEDATGMPAMLQGIGVTRQKLLAVCRCSKTTRLRRWRIAEGMDDYVTEPHHPVLRLDDAALGTWRDIKGDYQIDVRASSALVERDAQQQFMLD